MTSPHGAQVLAAICAGSIAWRSPDGLRLATGLTMDQVNDALAELESAGLVAAWDTPHMLVVTLTPLAAARLGVRIIEVDFDETPRWAAHDTPEPSPPRARGVFREYGCLAMFPSREPDPADVVEALLDGGPPEVLLVRSTRATKEADDRLTRARTERKKRRQARLRAAV